MAKQYNRVVQVIKKSYSLGQGIEDGFLATYKMHRIRTNIDKEGLHIQEALEKGAELFVPEEAAGLPRLPQTTAHTR